MGYAQNGFMNAFMGGNPNYQPKPTQPQAINWGGQVSPPQVNLPGGYKDKPPSQTQPWQPMPLPSGQVMPGNSWTNPITGVTTPNGGYNPRGAGWNGQGPAPQGGGWMDQFRQMYPGQQIGKPGGPPQMGGASSPWTQPGQPGYVTPQPGMNYIGGNPNFNEGWQNPNFPGYSMGSQLGSQFGGGQMGGNMMRPQQPISGGKPGGPPKGISQPGGPGPDPNIKSVY